MERDVVSSISRSAAQFLHTTPEAMDAAWQRAERRVRAEEAAATLGLSMADLQEEAIERGTHKAAPPRAYQQTGIVRIDPKALAATATGPVTVPAWDTAEPKWPTQNVRNWSAEGYRKNEIAFGCVREVAQSASEPKLRVYRIGDEEPLEDHAARRFIRRPNPRLTESAWMMQLLTTMEVAGNAVAWKQRTQAGGLLALWWLRPDRLRRQLASDGTIAYYAYNNGESEVKIPWEDIYHQPFLFDVLDASWGMSPFSVIARAISVDNRMTDFVGKFFDEAAVPYGLITTEQFLMDDDADRIADRWQERYSGMEGWSRPGVLGQGAKYSRMGLDFQEMAMDTLRGVSEARICMAFQVPPILVGAKVGLDRSTFANYGEARTSFWRETLKPIYGQVQDYLNLYVAPEFGSDIEYRFDLADVSELQEDRTARWTRATTAYTAGLATWAEARKEADLPTRTDVDDNLMRTFTQTPEVIGAEPERVLAPVAAAAGQRPRQAKAAGISQGFSQLRSAMLPAAERAISRHYRDLAASVAKRVRGSKAKLPDADDLLTDADRADLERRLVAFRASVGEAVYKLISDTYPLDVTFDPPAAFYAAVGADVVAMYATIVDDLADRIAVGTERGWTLGQLVDGDEVEAGLSAAIAGDEDDDRPGVRSVVATASLIALDQYVGSQNAAAVMAYREGGVTHVQVSDGTDDDEECATADGQTWTIAEADANPKEHPNCVRDFEPVITISAEE